jgi:F0F1-type ATP synthase epsilon subunit
VSSPFSQILTDLREHSTQVNIPAASGEMGVLANHVPSIEQLKPGLVEILEEGGATKQYFRMSDLRPYTRPAREMSTME